MAKKKRDWNKIILYVVVTIVTLSTIALYTPMFFNTEEKKPSLNPPKGTPYAKGPTSTPPTTIIEPSSTATSSSEITPTPEPTIEGTLDFNL